MSDSSLALVSHRAYVVMQQMLNDKCACTSEVFTDIRRTRPNIFYPISESERSEKLHCTLPILLLKMGFGCREWEKKNTKKKSSSRKIDLLNHKWCAGLDSRSYWQLSGVLPLMHSPNSNEFIVFVSKFLEDLSRLWTDISHFMNSFENCNLILICQCWSPSNTFHTIVIGATNFFFVHILFSYICSTFIVRNLW